MIKVMKENFPKNTDSEKDTQKESLPQVGETKPAEEWRELSPEEERELRDLIKQLQEKENE